MSTQKLKVFRTQTQKAIVPVRLFCQYKARIYPSDMYISPSSSAIAIAVILQQPMLDLLREIHLESDLLPTPYKILHLTLSKDVLQT